MKRYIDREALDALSINDRDTFEREREFAREEILRGRPVYYCRGEGHPVVRFDTLDEWELRDGPAQRGAN